MAGNVAYRINYYCQTHSQRSWNNSVLEVGILFEKRKIKLECSRNLIKWSNTFLYAEEVLQVTTFLWTWNFVSISSADLLAETTVHRYSLFLLPLSFNFLFVEFPCKMGSNVYEEHGLLSAAGGEELRTPSTESERNSVNGDWQP